jgi:energy-coupling factor transporter ATP-binding protein EcfA2
MVGNRNYSDFSTVRLNRTRHFIEIESPDVTVTFHPNDYDKTFNSIIIKCSELYSGYQLSDIDRHDIDVQLTEIYKDYAEERNKHRIKDAEHLVYLAKSQIKEQFRDQTGALYAVIKRDGNDELLKMNSSEFDRYLSRLYYESEVSNKVLSKNTIHNSKRVLESFATETRTLYHRIAKIGETIYYDMNNELWQCVKITKDGWEIVPSPMIFYRVDITKKQEQPRLPYAEISPADRNRRWVQELINKFYFKDEYQKKISEVYIITLFIPDISHPIKLVTGPRGSGKTLFLRSIRQIVDPRDPPESLVERLPRDEKDRRVSIYDSYFACFDNESHLSPDLMDELCTWVTGYSGTVRELYTTDEKRTFSAKRALGITGINSPITNSDAVNRAFISDLEPIPDGFDGNSQSKLIAENKFFNEIKKSVPDMLAYIFDVLVKALAMYEEVERQVKPNHRLADFVIWGEVISRIIGNKDNEFLEAWHQNTQQQNVTVVQNNPFAGLLVDYIFNYHRGETETKIGPSQLHSDLKDYAVEKKLDVRYGHWFPGNPGWLARIIQAIKLDLKAANILVENGRNGNERWIIFKKILTEKIDEYEYTS